MKQAKKYVVLAIFAVVIVVSLIYMGSVKINYNISDYLDESTETKISLNIMGEQFATTGNIQVMIEDITPEQVYEVYNVIKAVQGVRLVNFSTSDENYYKPNDDGKTGDALFAVIVEGDEYSLTATETLENIKAGLDDLFEGKTHYGGAVVEKVEMRNTMKKEIVIILAISVIFAYAIMLFMAKSWFEPLVLLVSSGVAVLINMGTNAIFGEISYITNAVAAILQLALSIDYSIVLLHNFRAVKQDVPDKHDAMKKAVKMTIRPVVGSAATTIAGLLALLLMTMKIGADIGKVLTKGIIISAFTALVMLPALLLVSDKLMQKTSKKDLVITGKKFCKIALKGGRAIILVAIALIVVCGGLHLKNTYSFVDVTPPNETLDKTFGTSNTIVVLYGDHGLGIKNYIEDERKLVEKLQEFTFADGTAPFISYTGYSNTVMESYTIDMAAEKMNIPRSTAELLFVLYHARNNNPEEKPLEPIEFVNFASEFLTPDENGEYKYADEGTVRMLQTLSAIHTIVTGNHTADEMYKLVSTGVMEGTGLTNFQISQMYGLYLWNEFDHDAVAFETMLDYMVEMTKNEDSKGLMDEETAEDLVDLADGLEDFKEKMGTLVTKEEFLEFGRDQFGEAGWVDLACGSVFALCNKNSDGEAKIVDILKLVDRVSNLIPEDFAKLIKNYTYVYDAIDDECAPEDFIPMLKKVVLALTDEEREVKASQEAIQQAYIMYFREQGAIPDSKINGFGFIQFVNETIANNATVAGQVTQESKNKLQDVVVVKDFVCDPNKYDYKEMTAKLNELRNNVISITSSSGEGKQLTEDQILAIYTLETAKNQEDNADPIIAIDLLTFVEDNMNGKLSSYMTAEHKQKVEERRKAIEVAEELFHGKEENEEEVYNRMLISIDMPSDSPELEAFYDHLVKSINEVFPCKHSHVAGHLISTYELQQSFDKDNQIITIFTIISIFAIVMVVFGSLSLPVILVAIIQGAIWISMSTSLLTGPMFFMSYIIATCILMGSTIDYGILMSTTYIDYRATMDKKEALHKAVAASMPTVFTSGLILTICGFTVGMVASMTSISTVGILLGKGTLVSVLVITLVLPSILYFLDGFLRLFTYKCGKERRKKRRTKRKGKRVVKKEKKFVKKANKKAKKLAKRLKRAKFRYYKRIVLMSALEVLFVYMWFKTM